MESLAEQIAKMTGGATTDTRPPNPALRTCPFCLERHEFRGDWTCSGCGEKATMHTDVTDCEECGSRRERLYIRNRLRSDKCDCGRTDEQKAFRQEQAAVIERNRALDEERRRAPVVQLAKERKLRGDADGCWKNANFDCSLPKDHFPFCRYCERWCSSSKLPAVPSPEFEEIDL